MKGQDYEVRERQNPVGGAGAEEAVTWPATQRAVETALTDAGRKRRLKGRANALLNRFPWVTRRIRGSFAPGVYIFLYHSVVSQHHRQEWEVVYDKGSVSRDLFERQIEFLLRHMDPVPLSQVPLVFSEGGVSRPLFVVTFDDVYRNIVENVAPFLLRNGISPTVFVNGAFTAGEVFYRVLAALLIGRGHGPALAGALRRHCPTIEWPENGTALFASTKDEYVANRVEMAVEEVFRESMGDPMDLKVHASLEEIRQLQGDGWEVGDHTYRHRVLSGLSAAEVNEALSQNRSFLENANIRVIDWLAYPVGRVRDVGAAVHDWLDNNPHVHGVFAGGGVNLRPSRTEWLRLSPGLLDGEDLTRHIWTNITATRRALNEV